MLPGKGRVPTFNLKPHPLLISALAIVIIGGLLLALSFHSRDDGSGRHVQQAVFTLIVTFVMTGCLLIMGTSKMWFPHLWHKNRSHKRHRGKKHHHRHRQHRDRL